MQGEQSRDSRIVELGKTWGRMLLNSLQYDHRIPVASQIRAIPSSRLMTYVLELGNPKDLDRLTRLEEQLALSLGAKSCRISRAYGEVQFEVPLPHTLWSNLYVKDLEQKDNLWISMGKTARLTSVHFKLDSPCIAPILVSGRTGSGKTELLKLMLWQLCMQNSPEDVQVILYDPKAKFLAWNNSAHLGLPVLRNKDEAIIGLRWLSDKLASRLDTIDPKPRVVFVIDELLMLMADNGSVAEYLGMLASVGREKGIHTILATQRPDRKHFDSIGAANIGLRVVGQSADTTEATVAAGFGGTGAHLLDGRGDMLAIQHGTVHRMQTALVRDRELGRLERGPIPNLPAVEDLPVGNDIEWTPAEMATALTGIGILKLRDSLKIGQPRATRLREYAKAIRAELGNMGHTIQKI